ncbi:helix-turn-helix domain-containing protein [Streptomyces syringium]|uniref:helix-turn-helix domain-containing protein n=1 Tax=Streptomyces syringium TaxID=76729 RepID=UPI0034359D60
MARIYLTGPERHAIAAQLAARYNAGEIIKEIATSTGRSITATRNLLILGGVTFRPRGTRRPA